MNLVSPSQVRALLAAREIRPSKAMGQNFLIDGNILRILLDTAALAPRDAVLEIGPGLGVVTEQLLARARRVVAIEKDPRLHAWLAERFRDEPRLELVQGDALEAGLARVLATGIDAVVSNLPYAAGSRILVELARAEAAPARLVVTVQREVAARLAAAPGGADYGMLTLWIGLVYDVRLVRDIAPSCFWPRPNVVSTIVELRRHAGHGLGADERAFFHALTKRVFAHRRKQLASLLSDLFDRRVPREDLAGVLAAMDLPATARPENLGVPEWCALTRLLRPLAKLGPFDPAEGSTPP